jgi:general secretion pathway protein C
MNKLVIGSSLCVMGVIVFAFLSLNDTSSPNQTSVNTDTDASAKPRLQSLSDDSAVEITDRLQIATENIGYVATTQKLIDELPIKVELMGLVYSKIATQSYSQLKVDDVPNLYKVDEEIGNTSVFVKDIRSAQVIIEFESKDYVLKLGSANSLEEAQNVETFSKMTPKEIGARPRQIEHIVRLLPNNFNDGGKVIIPGRNPALFRSAGFREGDVLLEVNGFSLDDENEFSEMQQQIRTAQTLVFKVNRAGQIVTLYLDIPHEALKL